MEDLKHYEASPPLLESWKSTFIDVLQGQIQHLFLTLLNAFAVLVKQQDAHSPLFNEVREGVGWLPLPSDLKEVKLCELAGIPLPKKSENNPEEPPKRSRHRMKCPTGVALLSARLCTFLEIALVPNAVEMMATMFPEAGSGDQPAFNPSEVIRKSNTMASDLLREYIELYGRSLTLMIRQSIAAANWLNHKEPRGPRPICDLIVTRLEAAEKEIVQLIDDGGNRSRLAFRFSLIQNDRVILCRAKRTELPQTPTRNQYHGCRGSGIRRYSIGAKCRKALPPTRSAGEKGRVHAVQHSSVHSR